MNKITNFLLTTLTIALISNTALAAVFKIEPVQSLPTSYLPGQPAIAFYKITNVAGGPLKDNILVNSLSGVTQITTDPVMTNLCSAKFSLDNGASCILKLAITAPVNNGFIKVCYKTMCGTSSTNLNIINRLANRLLVRVGENGTIATSTDGTIWTNRGSGTTNNLNSITMNENKYVAVGNLGTIVTSSDGINWTTQNSGTDHELFSVIWDGHQFIAVGRAAMLKSTDGIKWDLSSPSLNYLYSIIWTGSQYIAVGGDDIFISTDSKTWTTVTPPVHARYRSIVWSGERYVAVGDNFSIHSKGVVITSTDGKTWTKSADLSTSPLLTIIYDGSHYLVGDYQGTVWISNDSKNWQPYFTGVVAEIFGMLWDQKKYITVGGSIMAGASGTSADGMVWHTSSNQGPGIRAII